MIPETAPPSNTGAASNPTITPTVRGHTHVSSENAAGEIYPLCRGEYGVDGLFVGVPAKLGIRGMEQIVEIKLNHDEAAALKKSADAVASLCKEIDGML